MDNPPINGFITRKQASERCKRAERTLRRYWSRAIELSDIAILKNLKLRTEDGNVIDGKDVTKKKIDDLRKQGRNPTWFVHATWVERKYGPRLDDKPNDRQPHVIERVTVDDSNKEVKPDQLNNELVSVLKQQIADLKADKEKVEKDRHQDKQHHREDFKMLKEMFDTLKEDHEGTKKLLGKALDVGVEKLRQGDDAPTSTRRSTSSKKVQPSPRQQAVDITDHSSSFSFFERHLPTFSRPFRNK